VLEQNEIHRRIEESAAILVALATALHDYHRDAFDASLSDLLRLLQQEPSAIGRTRQLLIRQFNEPHSSHWRVTQAEHERRKRQVFRAITHANIAMTGLFSTGPRV
jgi:hypothetical protein